MELYEHLEHRRADIARHAENAARLAQVYASFKTIAQGSIEFEERIDFGLTFIEKPYVAYGSELDLEDLDELLGRESESNEMPPLPLASGVVTAWDQDDRDFWVGCWVAVRVWFPPDPPVAIDLAVNMEHHFTFAAIAMKDVPTRVD